MAQIWQFAQNFLIGIVKYLFEKALGLVMSEATWNSSGEHICGED